jgi:hypothetical protein
MKLKMIDFTYVLARAVEAVVHSHESEFVKSSGMYVWAESSSKSKRIKMIDSEVKNVLKLLEEEECKKPDDILVVLSPCLPKDNVLMSLKKSLVSSKLRMFIEEHPDVKWLLREKDIDIDIKLLNEAASKSASKMMSESIKHKSRCAMSRIVVLAHRKLDSHALEKVVEWAYGKSCCEHVEHEDSHVLVSVNSLLEKHT